MKKSILITAVLSLFIFTNCSKAKEAVETLNSLECLRKVQEINDNDDLTCSETIAELEKLERNCGAFDQETLESIALVKSVCED